MYIVRARPKRRARTLDPARTFFDVFGGFLEFWRGSTRARTYVDLAGLRSPEMTFLALPWPPWVAVGDAKSDFSFWTSGDDFFVS